MSCSEDVMSAKRATWFIFVQSALSDRCSTIDGSRETLRHGTDLLGAECESLLRRTSEFVRAPSLCNVPQHRRMTVPSGHLIFALVEVRISDSSYLMPLINLAFERRLAA